MLRSRHQMVESSGKMRNAPREKKPALTRVETRQLSGLALRVPARTQMTILRVRLGSKTRGGTAAPWSPDARCKQLCQRLGWGPSVRGLSPPSSSGFTNNQSEHHRAAQPSQQHAGRLGWQRRRTFALFLHCKNVLLLQKVISSHFLALS